jgi:hypothetical protein
VAVTGAVAAAGEGTIGVAEVGDAEKLNDDGKAVAAAAARLALAGVNKGPIGDNGDNGTRPTPPAAVGVGAPAAFIDGALNVDVDIDEGTPPVPVPALGVVADPVVVVAAAPAADDDGDAAGNPLAAAAAFASSARLGTGYNRRAFDNCI